MKRSTASNVATKVENPNDKAIIYLTDIFSLELPNTSHGSLIGLQTGPLLQRLTKILLTSPIHFPVSLQTTLLLRLQGICARALPGDPVPSDVLTTGRAMRTVCVYPTPLQL